MNLIRNLPGPLLIFRWLSLSFGGLIVKSFEGATLWQILFGGHCSFLTVLTFLFLNIKKNFKYFYD